jgi:polar amino acid transport system substrate-binding protein
MMSMSKKITAVLLAALMVLGLAAAGAETFIQGIDPEYPPFSYLDENGEYTGFDVEIAKAACEVAGLEYQVYPVDWDNKLIQLDAKECDVIWSGMTILDSMKESGYVISTPYYDNTQVLVVKKDSGITTSKDLAGKVVAVQLGTSGEALLNGDLADLKNTFQELITSQSFLMAFTELEGGSADAVFVDAPVAQSYVEGKDNLVILDEQLGAEQYGMAFRSTDAELCAKIEAAVQTLVENGTYAEIAAKYPTIVNNLLFLNGK